MLAAIDCYCKELGIDWTASCWDEAAIDFMEPFDPPFYKMASASLTDLPLLRKARATGRPLIISTGMSTLEEIRSAVEAVGATGKDGQSRLLIAHSTSTYPCPLEELNLRMIRTLGARYPAVPIGYSGPETGLAPSLAVVVLGLVSLSGTSPWIGRCGVPIRRPRSSWSALNARSDTSVTSRSPWAMASSASMTASLGRGKSYGGCGRAAFTNRVNLC